MPSRMPFGMGISTMIINVSKLTIPYINVEVLGC